MKSAERNSVLIIGDAELDLSSFDERELKYKRVAVDSAKDHFDTARAVLVTDFSEKFNLIQECYADLFVKAENHGLAQVVIVQSTTDLYQVAAIKQKDYETSRSKIYVINKMCEAAEYIAHYDIGPCPQNNLIIEPSGFGLTPDHVLLLKRVFHNCEKIYLQQLFGGKASLYVFTVYPRLLPSQSPVGTCPLPIFLKIASREEIRNEKDNYCNYAVHYIPFHLRPNLIEDKCVFTHSLAALTGNFVADAVPLRKSLKSGHGIGALFGLFETTLKGFRLQPFASNPKHTPKTETLFVEKRISAKEIKPALIEYALSLGSIESPIILQSRLCKAAEQTPFIVGPLHGDLHAGNVMVRGSDAILIDFGSACNGPLASDPAALEVSLVFGTDEDEKLNCFNEWCDFVDEIYLKNDSTLRPPELFEDKPGPFSWLRRALRVLRHALVEYAGKEEESKVLLATYLMRFARLPLEQLPDNDDIKMLAFMRHSAALVIAERIINGLSGGKGN